MENYKEENKKLEAKLFSESEIKEAANRQILATNSNLVKRLIGEVQNELLKF